MSAGSSDRSRFRFASRRASGLASWSAGIILATSGLGQQGASPPATEPTGRSSHEVVEKDRGKLYPVTPSTATVDANADLTVSFHPTMNGPIGSPGLDWKQASNALEFVRDNVRQRVEWTAKLGALPLTDSNRVDAFAKELRAFNIESVKRLRAVRDQAGFSPEEWDRILDGEFDGKPSNRPYENFARWLTNRLETLHRELGQFASRHTVQVTVQAFHLPRNGAQNPIHVQNYDDIQDGEYRPVDRLGLRMNEAEQEQFAAELQAAQSMAQSIREIRTNSAQFKVLFRAKLDEVRQKLDDLAHLLENEAAEWQSDFANTQSAKALEALANDANVSEDVRNAAGELREALGEFNDDFREASALYTKVSKLVTLLRRGGDADLAGMMLAIQQIANSLGQLNGAGQGLLGRLAEWPERLKRAEANAAVVAAHLAQEVRPQVLPDALRTFVKEFGEKFPATTAALQLAATVLTAAGGDGGAGAAAAAVASTAHEQIWMDVGDALPGTVELSRTGLTPGDGIRLQVNYREPGTNDAPGRLLDSDVYKVETVLMGFHREFGASVIFARGLRGDADEEQWKPNVAAHVHWFYRYRRETGGWRKTWNFVNPGLGVHMASLDQGEDSVEIGMGVNASFFDGVVVGGVGFNLTNDQRPYAFVGLSLLDLLESAKKLKR